MSTALTSGFRRALLAASIVLLAAAVVALRASNTRGEAPQPTAEAIPERTTR
jgi:anti-sigma-K factor RskA